MPTPVDSLRIGDWLTVVSRADKPDKLVTGGTPWQIKVIDLPFVGVLRNGIAASIDVRLYNVQRVSKRYARFFAQALQSEDACAVAGGMVQPPENPPPRQKTRK